eukprot:5536588-Alexandrium_andersonii.AAC.1
MTTASPGTSVVPLQGLANSYQNSVVAWSSLTCVKAVRSPRLNAGDTSETLPAKSATQHD